MLKSNEFSHILVVCFTCKKSYFIDVSDFNWDKKCENCTQSSQNVAKKVSETTKTSTKRKKGEK